MPIVSQEKNLISTFELRLQVVCPLCVCQVPDPGARVRRGALRLPGEEGQADPERGSTFLPPDHLRSGLLPQPQYLVSLATATASGEFGHSHNIW